MSSAADLSFLSIADLGRLLRGRRVSAPELAEHFLGRLEALGPRYNAVVTVTRDRALAEARQAQEELAAGHDRGPLHGIPYGAKDLLAARGFPTSWGAAPFRDQVIDEDATVIRRLRQSGAVLVAKLAMVEIAGGMGYDQANASFTGPGINPWNPGAWSGGSSSGPGSAVAAGLVPFAIGSETWGSITTPAAFCGVTGLRPTYGRVSRHGAMALSWTMDKIGPMCRTAADCGHVLAAIAGHDPLDFTTADRPFDHAAGPARFRLGVLEKSESAQPEVAASFRESLRALRGFADVDDGIALPDLPYGAVASTIIDAELASAFDGFLAGGKARDLTAPEDRHGGYPATVVLAKDYLNALRLRRRIGQALDDLLQRYDALVSPTLPFVASPLDASFRNYFRGFDGPPIGGAANAAGIPAVSVPNGFGERGLPTGLQLTGRAWEESRILRIAERFQAATGWHAKVPEVG